MVERSSKYKVGTLLKNKLDHWMILITEIDNQFGGYWIYEISFAGLLREWQHWYGIELYFVPIVEPNGKKI